jgi:transcriptional regulator with XRE-family HTH domain
VAEVLTPTQLRMARAALRLTTRALAASVGLSAMAISRYEQGDTGVLSMATALRLTQWFKERRLYFGPKDGVCLGADVFASERWLGLACYELLREHGIPPSSADLLRAYARFQDHQGSAKHA